MIEKKIFASNLRNLMDRQKMNQAALARKLDISAQAVSLWYTGRTYPECAMLLRLCEIFDVSADYLLTGHDTETTNVQEVLGLNDKAYEQLKRVKAGYYGDIIDRVNNLLADSLLYLSLKESQDDYIEVDGEKREVEGFAMIISAKNKSMSAQKVPIILTPSTKIKS